MAVDAKERKRGTCGPKAKSGVSQTQGKADTSKVRQSYLEKETDRHDKQWKTGTRKGENTQSQPTQGELRRKKTKYVRIDNVSFAISLFLSNPNKTATRKKNDAPSYHLLITKNKIENSALHKHVRNRTKRGHWATHHDGADHCESKSLRSPTKAENTHDKKWLRAIDYAAPARSRTTKHGNNLATRLSRAPQ